jgi:hypothetical protein
MVEEKVKKVTEFSHGLVALAFTSLLGQLWELEAGLQRSL